MKSVSFEGLTCYSFRVQLNYSALSSELGCLVLEASANPEYYAKNSFPPENKAVKRHLFFPVKKDAICFQDTVTRAAVAMRTKVNKAMHIYPGQLIYANKVHQCVHMQLDNTGDISAFLDDLKKQDIRFESDRKVNPYESDMIFKKHTRFIELRESVYLDADNPHRYFFKINEHIDFNAFMKGVEQIKANCNYHLFDSFLSHLFTNDEVIDFIGIYSHHCDESRFPELLENIKRVF